MCGPVTESQPAAFLLPLNLVSSSRPYRRHHPKPNMPPKPNKKKFVPLSSVATPKSAAGPVPSRYTPIGSVSAAYAVTSGPTPFEAASAKDGTIARSLAPHPAALRAAELANSSTRSHENEQHCFICTDPISWYAVGECNHRVCHLCSLRLRALLKDNNCSMCKTTLSDVIFTGESSKLFSDFQLNRMAKVDRKLSIHFDTVEAFDDVMILLRFNCPDADCDVACSQGWPELKKHVRVAHNKFLCDLCTRHKKLFTHEHAMYSQTELDRHFKTGDPTDPSFKGHPKCGFCNMHFYGDDELYEHCRKQHETCFLCAGAGIRHQYYENYDRLEQHFRKEHFCCMEPDCLEKKFQVFFSDIDLKAHEVQMHPTKRTAKKGQKIDIAFSIAGSPSLDLGARAGSGGGSGSGSGGRGGSRRRGEDRDQEFDDREPRGNSRLSAPPGFGSQLSMPEPTPFEATNIVPASRNVSDDFPAMVNAPRLAAPAPRYASSITGGIDRSEMNFPPPARAGLDRSESNFPPPSRVAVPLSSSASSATLASGGMDATTLKTLQELLNSDASKLGQFKSIARMYKTDITTCSEFLNFFIGLVFEGRQGASESVKREIVVKSGKVWRGLADSIPDEEAGNKLSQRERKLNASKREEMLRAWNDYKARNESDYSSPYVESSYANPASSSSSSSSAMRSNYSAGNKPSSPSQSVRVLSIKSKATHQRNTPMWNAMSKGKGFVSSLEDSKKQSPVFDMGGGSSSRSSSVSTEFRSGFTPQSETSGGSAQWGGSGSSGAQPRKTVASEFPGLPSRPVSKVPPYFKKDAAPVPAVDAWTAGAGGSSGGVDVYNPEENQGSGGKKKKKEKIVLMKVGL